MDGISRLTVDEAKNLGFEIRLTASAEDDCKVEASVTVFDDSRKRLGLPAPA